MSDRRAALKDVTARGLRSRFGPVRLGGVLVAAAVALLVPATSAFGEGSVDLNTGPDSAQRHNLAGETSNYTVLRVYARAGEKLQMGSSTMWSGFPGPPGANPSKTQNANILVYPPGTSFASQADPAARAALVTDPVFDTELFDCKAATTPPAGFIRTRAQELAGPLPNAGGYTPCEYTAPASGIYPVVMVPVSPGTPAGESSSPVGNPTLGAIQRGHISIWDVTVRDAAGTVKPGRVFTNRLSVAGSTSPSVSGVDSFFYTPSGYEYRVNFAEHAGAVWVMTANDKGVVDAATKERTFASFRWGTNDVINNNTRVHFEADAPQIEAPDVADDSRYPVFFNRPDPEAISGPGALGEVRGYATSPISPGSAFSNLALDGGLPPGVIPVSGSGGTLRFSSPPQMEGLDYALEIDIDRNGTFGNGPDVVHRAQLSDSGANEFAWNGKDGAGVNPPCGDYTFQVRSTLAEAHLTQSDVEGSAGTRIERLSLPGDPVLGDPLAANFNDVDPFKNTAATNTSPSAVTQGTSGGSFHAWSPNTGNTDFVDTWMRLPEVGATGAFEVCATEALDPPPTPSPPNVQPPPVSQKKARLSRTALRIEKDALDERVRAGQETRFRIKVTNTTRRTTISGVTVTDVLPSGLAYVRANRRASMRNGSPRWSFTLKPRQSKTITVRVRAARGLEDGKLVNSASVKAGRVNGVSRARDSVGVLGVSQRPGGVTG